MAVERGKFLADFKTVLRRLHRILYLISKQSLKNSDFVLGISKYKAKPFIF